MLDRYKPRRRQDYSEGWHVDFKTPHFNYSRRRVRRRPLFDIPITAIDVLVQ